MSPVRRAFAVFALACASSACGDDAGREPTPSPNASTAASASPSANAASGANGPMLEPVSKDLLVESLPSEVGEWRLKTVTGEQHALRRGSITSALATYERVQGEKSQKLALGVIDGARNPEAYVAFETAWAVELQNESLGYSHPTFGADRAVQILSRHPLTVQVHVLVAKRFLVQLDGEKVEPEETTAFLGKFPLSALRALE